MPLSAPRASIGFLPLNLGEDISPDERIAGRAALQHGTFTRAQAIAAGLSAKAIRHRRGSGRWIDVHSGVYVMAGTPRTWEQKVIACVFSLGPRAVAASETAACLHGLLNVVDTPVRVLLPKGQHRRTRPGIAVHEAILERTDIRTVSGIRVTAPNRTLVDLAGVRSERGLEAALDDAILLGLTTIASLRRYIGRRRLQHKPGAKTLRKLLDDRTPGVPQKELERLFLRKLRASRLPEPARQHPVGKRRIDFAYPDVGLAIELDGLRDHFSAAAFRNDRRRQNEIVLAGLTPLRFTWEDVNEHWTRVETTLRRALGLPESG